MKSLLVVALVAALQDPKPDHTKDSLDTVKENVGKKAAVLVDVREKVEWDAGHLEGAIFLPLSWLRKESANEGFAERLAEKLPARTALYSYCASGRRTLNAAEILKKAGYDSRPLKQGFEELKKAGFPAAEK